MAGWVIVPMEKNQKIEVGTKVWVIPVKDVPAPVEDKIVFTIGER